MFETAPAAIAVAARDHRVDEHGLSGRKARRVCVDTLDRARRFVTEHDRIAQVLRPAGVDVEVGMAHRGRRNPDERLARVRNGHGAIDKLKLARFSENHRPGLRGHRRMSF
jgi:hypothetical protein